MLFLCVLALPETEAPHLGVSSGGVEVEGVFAKFAGNGSLSSGRQLGRGGSGRYFAASAWVEVEVDVPPLQYHSCCRQHLGKEASEWWVPSRAPGLRPRLE